MFSATRPRSSVQSRPLNWDGLMASVKENFRRNLSLLIEKDGRKPIELARYLDVNPSTVSGWLSGRISINLSRLDEVALYFGVNYQDLLASEAGAAPAEPPDLDTILSQFARARGYRIVPKDS